MEVISGGSAAYGQCTKVTYLHMNRHSVVMGKHVSKYHLNPNAASG